MVAGVICIIIRTIVRTYVWLFTLYSYYILYSYYYYILMGYLKEAYKFLE